MSVTRQQRRQQLLSELESVRHLLLEPDVDLINAVLPDSIPTLSEVMPSSVIKNNEISSSAASTATSIPVLTPVINHVAPAAPVLELLPSSTESEAPTPNAMQQLIAKLTQRPATSSPAVPNENTSENPVNLLFTPVTAATTQVAAATLPILFQPVAETPIFQAPTFTELELHQPQFSTPQPQELQATDDETIDTEAEWSAIANAAINASAPQHTATLNTDDIEQLLFDIMPAVEELLRERLNSLLLKG